jgi:glutamyl-tRNA synthetase
MDSLILKHALVNAVEHGGKADFQAVLGRVLGEDPSLKGRIKEIVPEIKKVVQDVNSMPIDSQKSKLGEMGVSMEKRGEEERVLPPLENASAGKVVMRIAPNPNGPLHIGHARMVILNDEYAKMYKGKLILRFDDTDPKNPNKVPMRQAYRWIEQDLKWLGVKYGKVERASARLKTYYRYFETFLKMGMAYVCTCDAEKWAEDVRKNRKGCPCRELDASENLSRWKRMLSWRFKQGQAVGRIKTDLREPDPAAVDWVAFRIVDKPEHPLVGKGSKVWPMLDFASAMDDRDFGVTHILRGKDLMISEKRQKVIYEKMGWPYPITKVYGKVITTDDMVVSKSKIADGIKSGKYAGYDDPRLALLMAYRRKGILPQAIRDYIVDMGVNESETTINQEKLFAENRKLLDMKADRYMAVLDPVRVSLEGKRRVVAVPYHPAKKSRRKVALDARAVFVESSDAPALKAGRAELMYAEKKPKGLQKIHWVSKPNVRIKIVTPDAKTVAGVAEPGVARLKKGAIIQFYRIGFFRVDKAGKSPVLYFAHK